MLRRFLLLFACLASFAAFRARAAEVEFLRVWPAWHDAADFERIGEYFGAPEHHWKQTVLRTTPAERAGFYFLVRVKSAAPEAHLRFVVSVVFPGTAQPKTFSLPVDSLPAKETVFQLGLTGADWPGGRETHPIAWRVALVDAQGGTVAEQKSFLWEKPVQ